jgi:hypothetical protein
MVFVPMNFWTNTAWSNAMTPQQLIVVSNLCDDQLSGYNFVAYGALGDQPGKHQWHYLGPWQNLPQGNFIATWKFTNSQALTFTDPFNNQNTFNINPFSYTNVIPFPSESATNAPTQPWLPYLEFNYLGQLVLPQYADQDYAGSGIDIPLDKGTVLAAVNPATKAFVFDTAQIIETPPGNSTNIQYSVLHIDPLTGRGTLLFHPIQ